MATLPAVVLIVALAGQGPDGVLPDSTIVEEFSFGEFQGATRIFVDQAGRVFVVDADRNAVFVFPTPQDTPLRIGGFGWGGSSFDHPTGIVSDGLNVYVADEGNHRVQRFDRNLNYLSSFSTRDTSFADARFGYPRGVAVSRLGDVFVLDGENVRVLKFDPSLTFERYFPRGGSQGQLFRRPLKISASNDDRVFVADPDRIIEFDYFGNLITVFGESTLSDVRGFCTTGAEVLVVTSETIQFFAYNGIMEKTLRVDVLITERKIAGAQDVAVRANRLLLLDQNTVHVFRLD